MELEEEEAQICRLCGQCESIYINVFGEEGTKRFLGLKIHSKINILIDERDPLPKAICVQCLGKLEFVCDFQEECLRTQQVLRDRFNLPPLTDIVKQDDGLPQCVCLRCLGTLEFLCDFYGRCHLTQKELLEASQKTGNSIRVPDIRRENDSEADKENTLLFGEITHKLKTSPDYAKISRNESNRRNHEVKRENTKTRNCEFNKCLSVSNSNVTEKNSQKTVSCTLKRLLFQADTVRDQTKKSEYNNIVDVPKNENNIQESKVHIHAPKSISRGKLLEPPLIPKALNSIIAEFQEAKECEKEPSRASTRRRRRFRKAYVDQVCKPNCPLLKPRSRKKEKMYDNIEDINIQPKRHCLRAISTNSSIKANIGVSVPELPNDILFDRLKIVENDAMSISPVQVRDNEAMRSKPVSVIVKQEKSEDSCSEVLTSKKSLWIENREILCGPEKLKSPKTSALPNINPSPGDEADIHPDKSVNTSTVCNYTDLITHTDVAKITTQDNERIMKEYSNQSRSTVIKTSQTNSELPIPSSLKKSLINQKTVQIQECAEYNANISTNIKNKSLRRSSREISCNAQKNKEGIHGKISELMTDEQKETIETFYTVDMSVVDSEEVLRNVTIVDKKNIRCNLCNLIYLRLDKCQVHVWGHLKMKPYRCKACDFATVTVSNVRCHIRKSHLKIKPFTCHLCEKRYVTAVLLEEHINTHTGARPFKCKVCDFASASRQVLSYHKTTHKPVKDISCKVCGREFYSKGRMRAHMLVHNKDQVVMCKLCSAYLSNEEALELHHKNIHMRDYICNICGKHVKSRKALHTHQNVHAAAKYKCSLCENVYKSSHILKEHLLKHQGIRKYKCDVCEKSFAQQSHLAAHMAVHSKIRFYCPGCQRPFNRHDNMKIHTKRCKLFLANPELKNLLSQRAKSKATSQVVKDVDILQKKNDCENTDILTTTETCETKTDTNLHRSKTAADNRAPDRNNEQLRHIVQNQKYLMLKDIAILCGTEDNTDGTSKTGKVTIIENVLRPDSF